VYVLVKFNDRVAHSYRIMYVKNHQGGDAIRGLELPGRAKNEDGGFLIENIDKTQP
jgi:hypothetical protein